MSEIPNRVLREFSPSAPPMSFIEPFEEKAARALVDQQFKEITGQPFNLRPAGYMLACKIYVRPEEYKEITKEDGTKVILYLPDVARAEDKYQSVAALVCSMGPQAYKGTHADGTERYPGGAWCKVGDWIVIPRYEAFQITYHGVAMAILPDDKVLGVIEDPTDVIATHTTDRV